MNPVKKKKRPRATASSVPYSAAVSTWRTPAKIAAENNHKPPRSTGNGKHITDITYHLMVTLGDGMLLFAHKNKLYF